MIKSGSYPNLVNGISQQAAPLRFSSQGSAQVNAVSSVVRGLTKRPPTKHIKKLTTSSFSKFHFINRDSSEQYVVCISSSGIKVFDLAGTEKTVAIPNGVGYLTSTNPTAEAIRCITLEDYTFITNRDVVMAMKAATTSPAAVNQGVVWIKAVVPSHSYSITVNASTYTYTVPATGVVKTSDVAASLAAGLQTLLTGALFTVTQVTNSSTIRVTRVNGAAFTMNVSDSYGNQAMALVKGAVNRSADLPSECWDGYIIHIAGDPAIQNDDYYVKFATNDAITFGKGTWNECIKPGISTTLDPAKMPHVLVREADGTFTFKEAPWLLRTVGDDTTNPQPSFIGNTIKDTFFFKGRLGFLAGENVILSRAGDVFDFWRKTAATLVDDDPIDVQDGGAGVSIFYSACPFNNQLLLFSDRSQHTLTGGDILTNKTVSITLTTSFDALTVPQPVNVGNSVFFAFPRGTYSGVREYFVTPQSTTNDAADITAHVPTFIKGNIVSMTTMTADEFMLVTTDDTTPCLYCYQWKWSGDQKVQSAWHRWDFDVQPSAVAFVRSVAYLVFTRWDGLYLESCDLMATQDTGLDFLVNLDRRTVYTTSFSLSDGFYYYNLPYSFATWTTGTLKAVLSTGVETTVTIRNGTAIKSSIPLPADTYIGTPYTFSYTFTPPFIKEQTPSGGFVAISEGRLQISTMRIQYDRSSSFDIVVRPDANSSYTNAFRGATLGGTGHLESGAMEIPVRCRNLVMDVTISNASYLPSNILSAEWTGTFVPKSNRA